ncbi:MAG TPA: hypothetical protein VFE12_03585, partial [Acetobacteraceae bacterium]|nr:hypothetical protein [Acetobacteraceae bacterium]
MVLMVDRCSFVLAIERRVADAGKTGHAQDACHAPAPQPSSSSNGWWSDARVAALTAIACSRG